MPGATPFATRRLKVAGSAAGFALCCVKAADTITLFLERDKGEIWGSGLPRRTNNQEELNEGELQVQK